MVDIVLSQENEELEALLSLMSQENIPEDQREHTMSDFGSDVDDYDSVFLDALAEAEGKANRTQTTSTAPIDQAVDSQMDTSMD